MVWHNEPCPNRVWPQTHETDSSLTCKHCRVLVALRGPDPGPFDEMLDQLRADALLVEAGYRLSPHPAGDADGPGRGILTAFQVRKLSFLRWLHQEGRLAP